MSEDGEMWAEYLASRQAKRAANRAHAESQLRAVQGITATTANGGEHYVISSSAGVIDFWPGTGLWIVRGSTRRRRGITGLILFINDTQRAKP